jgi:predicted DNA binding protein
MVRARLAITLLEEMWIARVSTAYPDTEFRLLTGLPIDDGAIEVGEVSGPDIGAVGESIREESAIESVDVLFADETTAVAQYRTIEQTLYRLSLQAGTPPTYPLTIQGGKAVVEVTAPREQIGRFRDRLEAVGMACELLSLTEWDAPEDVLTERQRELIQRALDRGYYAAPRECTLTDLAAEFEIDKSSASAVLHRAEGRIVRRFLQR